MVSDDLMWCYAYAKPFFITFCNQDYHTSSNHTSMCPFLYSKVSPLPSHSGLQGLHAVARRPCYLEGILL
jgi:hypothetical protein